jgi:D-alanyl-D-alanine carboxypeptidase/D-alanyl-D-alanine-endopeptidase (penicillin-binding protein 4)
MKYLGDSLVGLRYSDQGDSVTVYPTGDPTFLHPDYKQHPAYDFLKKEKEIFLTNDFLYKDFLGNGWSWNDFKDDYMAQRNSFPIYGNVATIKWFSNDSVKITPAFFHSTSIVADNIKTGFDVIKGFEDNHYVFVNGNEKKKAVPFRPDIVTIENLLVDTLHFKISLNFSRDRDWRKKELKIIHSQPTDSLFKPMMHRSDNFFAEQTLLMASNEHLGFMNDEKIIDTILNKDLAAIPQRPKWVDGSGLSRYNLFTPKSFVYILNKMKNEFGLERMKVILPTGGEGTLLSYYKKDAGFIFAKTGTLSNNCALSGYIITRKGKLLIVSVLANNYITGATPVRRAVEHFIQQLREKY